MIILHIIAGLGGGGRERRMGRLVMDLSERKFAEQHIVFFQKMPYEYTELLDSGAKFHFLQTRNRFKLLIDFYKICREIRPDIVHVWTEIPVILLGVSLYKLFFRFKLIIGFLADGNPIKGYYKKVATKISYIFSDKIVSNSLAGIIAKSAPKNKSVVIYNGFDTSTIVQVKDKMLYKQSLGITTPFVICMAARFSPAKDWQMFLDVAKEINNKRNDTTFIAIGSGTMLTEAQNYCQTHHLSNVIFLGQRNDVMQLYQICNISILFTNNKVHAEGVSNTIMESMASGCPVVATRGGGTTEIITNNINGFVVEPKDVKSVVDILDNLLDHPLRCETLSESAKDSIKQKFSLKDKTNQYIGIYNFLLKLR